MTEQLWDDERMRARADEHRASLHYGTQVNAWALVAREMRDDMQERIAELERINDSRGWVSVEERLPDMGWYLVYADGAMNCAGYTPGKGWEDWCVTEAPNVNLSQITHWRELPEPPQEDTP